jgi:ribosomal-protein-alanine N-acetyltransferase
MTAVFAAVAHPITIRSAHWRDLPSIRRLQRECFGADGYGWPTLLGLFLSPYGSQHAAIIEGALVGFAASEVNPFDGCGWVVTIGVLPKFRERGVASSLLETAESWSAASHMARMRLTVRPSNDAAIRLYTHKGYARVSIRSRYYADGEDGWVMEKSLDRRA